MYKYEVVSKKEFLPVRQELENIINKLQKLCRKENSVFSFKFDLVGSGGRHLITREKGNNKGFDFDYNLILNDSDVGDIWQAKYAKELIIKNLKKVLVGTSYSKVEDSTSVITIKVVDRENSKILHSCDFAIIYYPDGNESNYFKYVRFNRHKKNPDYTWEIREESQDYNYKLDWLKDNINNYWNIIKEEYLKVKNANKDLDKHSFQLYYETINNVFNNFYDEDDEDDEE